MSKKKQPVPPVTDQELGAVAKILSTEKARRILKLLNYSGYSINSSIIRITGFSASTTSKQLSILKKSDLVLVERLKSYKIYSINKDRFSQLGLNTDVWLGVYTDPLNHQEILNDVQS